MILPQENPLIMPICIMTTLLKKLAKRLSLVFCSPSSKTLYKPKQTDSPTVQEHPGQKLFLQPIFFSKKHNLLKKVL